MNFSGTDTTSQIALVNRGTNTLIRMPYNPVLPGAPPGMNMMGSVGGGGIGLGQVIGPPGQGDGMDPFDRELQMRIDKMRKKRASIPPFVQKLSRYAHVYCLCFYPMIFFFPRVLIRLTSGSRADWLDWICQSQLTEDGGLAAS